MEITSDILLKGTAWNRAIDELGVFFEPKRNYNLYMLSLAIGIMYDKRIENPEENGEEHRSVPRNVIANSDNGKLDFYFQAAILSTRTENFSEDRRLELAFGENEKIDFNKIGFLSQFANFGITKLVDLIGTTELESMENIKNFFVSTVEGRNLEIDSISDDILLEDMGQI